MPFIAFFIGLVLPISLVPFFNQEDTLGSGGGGALWFLSSGNIRPVSATTGLQVPGISASGDECLQISSSGVITATGSGCGGAGSSEFNDAGAYVYPKEGDYVSAPYFSATSTTASSFPYASSTAITATNFWGTASLATALGANGSNCSAGNAPLGVDASGAVESCFDVWTEAENTSAAYLNAAAIDTSAELKAIVTDETGSSGALVFANSPTFTGTPVLPSTFTIGANSFIRSGAHNLTLTTTGATTLTLPTSGTLAALTSAMTGTFDGNNFADGAVAQGDILYGSAAGVISELPKNTSATRYLSNTGTSNNPAWAQVNLANGITGTLPVAHLNADYGDFTCNGTTCSLDATYATSLDTAYNGGASITADGGAVAITVPNASNNAGLTIAQNDTTNSPVALHILTVDNNSGAGILIENEGDGPTDTAFFDMYQDSASPAIADEIGRIRFLGKDSGGSIVYPYAEILATIQDPTNTSEDGTLSFKTVSAGANRTKLYMAGSLNGVSVGDSSVGAGILSSNGNQDLTLQTGNTTTGNITITDGANGNITVSPNGTGKFDLSSALVKQHTYKSFTWPGTPTTTTATTTVPLGTAYTAEAWNGAECYTTSGTSYLVFTDGTNDMNPRTATTTVGRFTLSTNNTFTASEKRYVEIGALTAAQLSCTIDVTINN